MQPLRSPGVVAAIVFLVVLASCGISSSDSGAIADGESPPPSEERFEGVLSVDGEDRTFTLVVPPSQGALLPLVIAMHGGGGSAAQFENTSELTPAALAAGYAVVYPNGIESRGPLGLQTWNGGACCGRAVDTDVDDVAFISRLLELLERDYPIDPTRIFATGHSNGGMMAYRLACESSDRIAAVAANGTAMVVDDCAPTRPVPVLHLHSVLDENVPVGGGAGVGPETNEYPPLDATIGSWVAINGCPADPDEVTAEQVTHRTWGPCEADTVVELYLTDDGGHGWPGGQPGSRRGDEPSTAIDANELMLEFFSRFALPG